MSRRTIDFDRAWAETARARAPAEELPDIRMHGEVFPRLPSLPAAVTLWMGRLTEDRQGDTTSHLALDDVVDLLKLIVPLDVLDRWLTKRKVGEEDLRRSLVALVALYHGHTLDDLADDGEGGDGSGEAVGGSSTGSSADGSPSKPTSSASTEKT